MPKETAPNLVTFAPDSDRAGNTATQRRGQSIPHQGA